MPKNILIATTNPGKIYEYKHILQDFNTTLNFIFLDFFEEVKAPDETGLTYQENALIKAEYYFKCFNIPVISDDSGMEVSTLNGIPGIHTARFIKEHKDQTFQKLNSMILEKDPNAKTPPSSFHCCTIYKDHDLTLVESAYTQGVFTYPPQGHITNSFGYDPIFKLPEINKTLAEIDTSTKLLYSPRAKAMLQILKQIDR